MLRGVVLSHSPRRGFELGVRQDAKDGPYGADLLLLMGAVVRHACHCPSGQPVPVMWVTEHHALVTCDLLT